MVQFDFARSAAAGLSLRKMMDERAAAKRQAAAAARLPGLRASLVNEQGGYNPANLSGFLEGGGSVDTLKTLTDAFGSMGEERRAQVGDIPSNLRPEDLQQYYRSKGGLALTANEAAIDASKSADRVERARQFDNLGADDRLKYAMHGEKLEQDQSQYEGVSGANRLSAQLRREGLEQDQRQYEGVSGANQLSASLRREGLAQDQRQYEGVSGNARLSASMQQRGMDQRASQFDRTFGAGREDAAAMAAYRAAQLEQNNRPELSARAKLAMDAGLVPGSPEYQEFLLREKGSLVTNNIGSDGTSFGKPPKDFAWARAEDGSIMVDGRGAPIPVPLQNTKAFEDARGANQSKEQTIATITDNLSAIDQAINHPGRTRSTGLSSIVPNRPGSPGADYAAVQKQLEGKAFLQAFESLKGGGQITEVEGQKATQAIARLQTSQSDEAYLAALQELRGITVNALERAKRGDPVANTSIGETQTFDGVTITRVQ